MIKYFGQLREQIEKGDFLYLISFFLLVYLIVHDFIIHDYFISLLLIVILLYEIFFYVSLLIIRLQQKFTNKVIKQWGETIKTLENLTNLFEKTLAKKPLKVKIARS